MSAHNTATQLEDATTSTSASSGKIFNWATAAPAGGELGYMKGALWIVTGATAASGSTRLFINTSTSGSATWVAITTAS